MNIKKTTVLLLLLSSFIFAQPKLTPIKVSLNVDNIKLMSNWYQKNLNFKIDTIITSPTVNAKSILLKKNNFWIELIENKKAVRESTLSLPEGYRVINGYSKLGFAVDNLNIIYKHLKKNGVSIFREISKGELFDGNYFIITDPEGNYLQFFCNVIKNTNIKNLKLKPFIISKMVGNIYDSIDWYKNNFGFKESESLEFPDQNLKIAFIENNGFYFELIQTNVSLNKSLVNFPKGKDDLLGFVNLSFFSEQFENLYQKSKFLKLDFFTELQNENLKYTSKFFILKDPSESLLEICN